jgi:hypothetical protein
MDEYDKLEKSRAIGLMSDGLNEEEKLALFMSIFNDCKSCNKGESE